MKCLIVDDNKLARTVLKQLAGKVPGLELVAELENAMDAYQYLQQHPVDLVLLDIEMPDMSGLELIKALASPKPLIIFTTSKKDYAIEAFELNVVDYLVKPIAPARFLQAIDRARSLLDSNSEEVTIGVNDFIFIKDSNVVRRIPLADILFFEAMGDYVKIHTTEKPYTTHATLKSIEDRLSRALFIRVHRSYIIALNKIDTIQEGTIQIRGKAIPVAEGYRSGLNAKLKML